jgi:hypothetical protein
VRLTAFVAPLLALALGLPGPTPAADEAPRAALRVAQIRTAGGSTKTAWKALDWDVSTSWCQKSPKSGVTDDLEIEFDQPVRVKEIEIIRSRGLTTSATSVQILTDNEDVSLDFEGYSAPIPVQAPPLQQPTRKLRFRPLPASSPHCLADIVIRLHDGPWVFDIPPTAIAGLPKAISEITTALRNRDLEALGRGVGFPLRVREFSHGAAGADRDFSVPGKLVFRSPKALANTQWMIGSIDDEMPPNVDAGIRPGTVRVHAGAFCTSIYWYLTWRQSRWVMTQVTTAFFE